MIVNYSSQTLLFRYLALFSRVIISEFNLFISERCLEEVLFSYLSSFKSLSIMDSIYIDIFQLKLEGPYPPCPLLPFMFIFQFSKLVQSSQMASSNSSFLCSKSWMTVSFSFRSLSNLSFSLIISFRSLLILETSWFLMVICEAICCWYLASCCLQLESSSYISPNYCCIMVKFWEVLNYIVFSTISERGLSSSSILSANFVLAIFKFLHMSFSSLILKFNMISLRVSCSSFYYPCPSMSSTWSRKSSYQLQLYVCETCLKATEFSCCDDPWESRRYVSLFQFWDC